MGNANWLTAAICRATGNQPAAVCSAVPIPQIEAQLVEPVRGRQPTYANVPLVCSATGVVDCSAVTTSSY